MSVFRTVRALALSLLVPGALGAQTAPAADAPSIKVGAVLFTDVTWQEAPKQLDADGNQFSATSFNVTRAYVNVTGTLTKRVAFRITPDIVRETGSGSGITGSYVYRLKYAYGQYNLDDWAPKGSFARIGMQQTPYIDYFESVYKYRFMGPTFADREGFAISSDLGISGKYVFPADYGDVHAGVYNGEGYARSDPNDQKSFQARASYRPFPASAKLKGLRFAAFLNADHYQQDAPRDRTILNVLYDAKQVSTGVEYLTAKDKVRASAPELDARGWSLFVAPHLPKHVDLFFRHDSLERDVDSDARKNRNVAGIVYWLPLEKVSSAISFDYEGVTYKSYAPDVHDETRWAIHTMITF